VRIGRFAVGEGGADLLREIDRQSSLAVVRDESAGRTKGRISSASQRQSGRPRRK